MVIFQYTAIFIKLDQYTAMKHQKMVQQDKNNSDALTQNIHQYESDGSFIKKLVPSIRTSMAYKCEVSSSRYKPQCRRSNVPL